jgi:hypothetical protein
MEISTEKTKIMAFQRKYPIHSKFCKHSKISKHVNCFKYLRDYTTYENEKDTAGEIQRKLQTLIQQSE